MKAHIVLFICFSTKEIHLEVVSDLILEVFLACLRRFVARQSKPTVIWNDNVTNFKCFSLILKFIYQTCTSNKIQKLNAEK